MFLAALRHRDRQPELMDDPALSPQEHHKALVGLARINRWTGSAAILWSRLRPFAPLLNKPLRILDVGTGSGDIPRALAKLAQRDGIPLEIAGCDISPVAIAEASRLTAGTPQATSCRFFVQDVLRDPLPTGFDAVICSLFVHHLDEPDALTLFTRMREATDKLVLVNDLARGRFNFLAVSLASRLLSRSRIVHVDGPLSVRAAFTVSEMQSLAERAGLRGAVARGKFPCRQLLTWEKV